MASTCTSIKRSRESEDKDVDSDEYWRPSSSPLKTHGKRIKKKFTIPSETSKWTEYDLQRINISYSDSIISSPDELIDQFELIKVEVPELDEDFIRIYEYVQSKFNFDFSGDDLHYMKFPARRCIVDQLHALFKDLTTENEEKQILKQHLKEESQFMVDIIRVAGSRFVSDLINFLAGNSTFFLDTVYTSLLERFCEICNFNGSAAVRKQTHEILHVYVTSVPDLVFMKPWIYQNLFPNRDCIISVADVKKYDITGHEIIEKRQTNSSDSCGDLITVPQHMRGLAQHTGQLLLANPDSFVPDHSLGIVLNKTKGVDQQTNMATVTKLRTCGSTQVIFTCLALTKNYLEHLGRRLDENDKGVVYTCGPYDLLKASDRQILLKTFLRFGLAQQKLYM